MANRFLIPAGGNWVDGTTDIWAAGSGGAADGGGIVSTDTAKLDGNSGNLEISGGGNCWCAAFDTTTYTNTATVTTAHGPVLGIVTVAAGTLNTGIYVMVMMSRTLSGGTIQGSGVHLVGGDIIRSAGTHSFTGTVRMTAPGGDLEWFNTSANLLNLDVPTGVVCNLAATSYIAKLTGAGTVSTATAKTLYLFRSLDNFWTFTGTCSVVVNIAAAGALTSGGPITVTSNLIYSPGAGRSLAMDGDLTVGGNLGVYSASDGTIELDMAGFDLSCAGTLTIGHASDADRTATVTLGTGDHELNDVAKGAAAGGTLAVDSSRNYLNGTLTGTGLTITGNGGRIVGPGTITACAVTGRLIVWGELDDGTNSGAEVEWQPLQLGTMPMAMAG